MLITDLMVSQNRFRVRLREDKSLNTQTKVRPEHLTKKSPTKQSLKKAMLRNNEYYNFQEVQDSLYEQSKLGRTFHHLMELILDERNLRLAYRNVKTNKGSKTAGVNGHTIKYWDVKSLDEYTKYMRNRLNNYIPMAVRRVEIPKPNGKKRPLGIPTMEDRLIQQAIKQVLEPICEAKFYPYSFGFRPNRSTEHAIACFVRKVNIDKCYYVVDIDIKGFFDNVNHGKLLKQMWSLGIRDKNLICIISRMLKAEIQGIGVPTKGTPQGGILSPLLSNIVLNELDWWISSQWENMSSRHNYTTHGNKYAALRKNSKLKEMYIVRYADDFKIMCKDIKTAKKCYYAVKAWLKERLGLEISDEKSKITNLRKSSSEFLGFQFKAQKKRNKHIIQSHISEKSKSRIKNKLKETIRKMRRYPTEKSVGLYNSQVLGIQNYYSIATMVSLDLNEVAYQLSRKLKNCKKQRGNKTGHIDEVYKKRYKTKSKKIFIAGKVLYPLGDIQTKHPMNINQEVCDYTEMGRKKLHKASYVNVYILKHLMMYPNYNETVLFNDNRLSLYAGQLGKCALTGETLKLGEMEVHHIIPKHLNGTDKYQNLVYLTTQAHHLIHYGKLKISCEPNLITLLLSLNKKSLDQLQEFRRLAANLPLELEYFQELEKRKYS